MDQQFVVAAKPDDSKWSDVPCDGHCCWVRAVWQWCGPRLKLLNVQQGCVLRSPGEQRLPRREEQSMELPRDKPNALWFRSCVVMKWSAFCIADTNKLFKAGNSFKWMSLLTVCQNTQIILLWRVGLIRDPGNHLTFPKNPASFISR